MPGRIGKHFATCNSQLIRRCRQQQTPQPYALAHMLPKTHAGIPDRPRRPSNLTENPRTPHEFQCVVGGVTIQKSANKDGMVFFYGLVAGVLLKHSALDDVQLDLLHLFNDTLSRENVPSSCNRKVFRCSPTNIRPKCPSGLWNAFQHWWSISTGK